MMRANYHTHCSYCDGASTPEDFVRASIARNMAILGFSSHAPLPFPNVFTMPEEKLADYVATILNLKKKYAEDIQIFLGLEVDYIPGLEAFQSSFAGLNLDYTIGSIHFVDRDEMGNPWAIDADRETFVSGIAAMYHGHGRTAVERYYQLICQMIQETRHNIVGHLDVIKKNNGAQQCFSEDASWYTAAVDEALAMIAEDSRIVEVSTAGIRKGVGIYPSPAILKRCKEFNIRLTLSSDAHSPSELSAGYSEAETLLWNIGYRELYQLTPQGWAAVPLK